MLMLILLVTHALRRDWRGACAVHPPMPEARARWPAARRPSRSRSLGSLPLWFGPAGELLAGRHPWIIDAVIGISPLTHLAVASGNDLLRNPWFYQHSNLAALQFSYPSLAELILSYASVSLALALIPLASRRLRRRIDAASVRPIP